MCKALAILGPRMSTLPVVQATRRDVPLEVVAGLYRYTRQHEAEGVTLLGLLEQLRWDPLYGCYAFVRAGMFHGVEVSGYIHT